MVVFPYNGILCTLPCGSVIKYLPANAGATGGTNLIPGFGRSPGKEMATHSSILAWEIPLTGEPGGIIHRVAELDTTE